MKRSLAAVFALFATLTTSERAMAQTDSGNDGAVRALLLEVRQLRQAVEKQSSATTRAQLLVTRLTLQDQRVAKAQAAMNELTANIERQTENIAESRTIMNAAFSEKPTEAAARAQFEQQMRDFKERISQMEAGLPAMEARLEQAKQALETERGKYDALDSLLTQLDLDLSRKGSEKT